MTNKLDEIKEHYGGEVHICADRAVAPFARDTNADFQWLVVEVDHLQLVEDIVRQIAAKNGHNLPGWVECANPGNCLWDQLDAALDAVDKTRLEASVSDHASPEPDLFVRDIEGNYHPLDRDKGQLG